MREVCQMIALGVVAFMMSGPPAAANPVFCYGPTAEARVVAEKICANLPKERPVGELEVVSVRTSSISVLWTELGEDPVLVDLNITGRNLTESDYDALASDLGRVIGN